MDNNTYLLLHEIFVEFSAIKILLFLIAIGGIIVKLWQTANYKFHLETERIKHYETIEDIKRKINTLKMSNDLK